MLQGQIVAPGDQSESGAAGAEAGTADRAERGRAWVELIEHAECCALCFVIDDPEPNSEAMVSTSCADGRLLLAQWMGDPL